MSESSPESIILTSDRIDAMLIEAGRHALPALDEVLALLRPRAERIIRMRYGLGTGCPPMTLEEIGQKEGLTRERIRQLQNQALERLQHPSCRPKVMQFIKENMLNMEQS